MSKKRLLLTGAFALAFGALSSFQVYQRLRREVDRSRTEVDVIVAAHDIQVGAKIGNQDVTAVKYRPGNLPADVFHNSASVLGRGAVLPIRKGEFVLPDKLADQNAGEGLSALIATGMRAVAVRVNDVTSVNGFTVPGARVDVLVIGNITGSSDTSAFSLLQDVAVLANGQKIERPRAGEPQSATVVTLLVSPEDAEKLALASQEAHIQLVLRNPLDTNQEKPITIRRTTLFGNVQSDRPLRLARIKHAANQPTSSPKFEIDLFRGTQKQTIDFEQ